MHYRRPVRGCLGPRAISLGLQDRLDRRVRARADLERSRNLDVGLRKTAGAWRGKVGVFVNRVRNFVYARSADTDGDGVPDRVDDTGALTPTGDFRLIN